MNDRIRQLALQAYEQQPMMIANPETFEIEHKIGNGGVPMYHRVFNQEKFAQLIVRECLNQCYNRGMNDELYAGQLKAAAFIEEHFGVE